MDDLAGNILSIRSYGACAQRHAHPHSQVLWALDGCLELEIDGRPAALSAGDGLVIRPGEAHDFEAARGSRCLVLDSTDPSWLGRPRQPAQHEALQHLTRYLEQALQQGLVLPLALGPTLLAQSWGPLAGATRARRDIDWAGLNRWLTAHLAQPISVRDMAQQVHLSESQLRARFVTALGCSPMQWLRQLRLQHAQALRATGVSVAQAAQRCGYDSPSALTAALRRSAQTGESQR